MIAGTEEVQVFPYHHIVVHAKKIRHITDHFTDQARLTLHRMTCHQYVPRSSLEQSTHDPNCASFSGTIGTHKTKDIPFFNRQVKLVDGFWTEPSLVLFRQVLDFDNCRHSKSIVL